MRKLTYLSLLAPVLVTSACKPPPTDAGLDRDMPVSEPTFASAPLDSPDTEGAMWAPSSEDNRIIYGIPGQPALVALACITRDGPSDLVRISRLVPADEGAGAILALIGNGSIGRIAVDATEFGNRHIWQGEAPASDTVWEPLVGPRQVTVTVPGAGIVPLNSNDMPLALLNQCRGIPSEVEPEDGSEDEPMEEPEIEGGETDAADALDTASPAL